MRAPSCSIKGPPQPVDDGPPRRTAVGLQLNPAKSTSSCARKCECGTIGRFACLYGSSLIPDPSNLRWSAGTRKRTLFASNQENQPAWGVDTTRRPPGFVTRRISRKASARLAASTCSITSTHVTASKTPSSNGSSQMSAWTKEMRGFRSLAVSRAPRLMSTPVREAFGQWPSMVDSNAPTLHPTSRHAEIDGSTQSKTSIQ
jgi:hypothetical protein